VLINFWRRAQIGVADDGVDEGEVQEPAVGDRAIFTEFIINNVKGPVSIRIAADEDSERVGVMAALGQRGGSRGEGSDVQRISSLGHRDQDAHRHGSRGSARENE